MDEREQAREWARMAAVERLSEAGVQRVTGAAALWKFLQDVTEQITAHPEGITGRLSAAAKAELDLRLAREGTDAFFAYGIAQGMQMLHQAIKGWMDQELRVDQAENVTPMALPAPGSDLVQ